MKAGRLIKKTKMIMEPPMATSCLHRPISLSQAAAARVEGLLKKPGRGIAHGAIAPAKTRWQLSARAPLMANANGEQI